MYPNPAKAGEPVYFKNVPDNTLITVFSATGEKMNAVKNHRKQGIIETEKFESGIYFVSITDGKCYVVLKLIIK